MRMKRSAVCLLIFAFAALAGCGSSGTSEADAVRLLNAKPGVSDAGCAKVQGREFVCHADVEEGWSSSGSAILHVTVAEDGETIVVTDCKQKEVYGRGVVACEVR